MEHWLTRRLGHDWSHPFPSLQGNQASFLTNYELTKRSNLEILFSFHIILINPFICFLQSSSKNCPVHPNKITLESISLNVVSWRWEFLDTRIQHSLSLSHIHYPQQYLIPKMIKKKSNLSMDFFFLRRHRWIQTSFEPKPLIEKAKSLWNRRSIQRIINWKKFKSERWMYKPGSVTEKIKVRSMELWCEIIQEAFSLCLLLGNSNELSTVRW